MKKRIMKVWVALFIPCLFAFVSLAQAQAGRVSPSPALPYDSLVNDYLAHLTAPIMVFTGDKLSCSVKVTADDNINAYAVWPSEVRLTRGMLQLVDNEAELVFVLAQQLGYFVAQQSAQAVPLSITDTDRFAVDYLYRAGYDPIAAVRVLEKLRALRRQKNYLQISAQPQPEITFLERIRSINYRLTRLASKPEYVLDSSAFKAMKKQIETRIAAEKAEAEQADNAKNSSSP